MDTNVQFIYLLLPRRREDAILDLNSQSQITNIRMRPNHATKTRKGSDEVW